METAIECICCLEIEKVTDHMKLYEEESGTKTKLKCLKDHPGFQTVCLDVYVLGAAYKHYALLYPNDASQLPPDLYR